MGDHDYTFLRALAYVLSQSWVMLYQTMPMMGFIGALVGLARLAAGNELIVMQTSGYSLFRVAGVIAGVGFLISLVVVVVVQLWGSMLPTWGKKIGCAR